MSGFIGLIPAAVLQSTAVASHTCTVVILWGFYVKARAFFIIFMYPRFFFVPAVQQLFYLLTKS
ncbi:MAG: hypothetical protein RLZZ316_90 [Bacteroidota bacterium]